MSFRKLFFLFFATFLFFSLVFSSNTYDITFCSPDIFTQDMDQVDVNILVPEKLFDPCKYNGISYPIISFSNPKIKIVSTKFSPFFIKTKISIDKSIEPKSYDVKIISCNENGKKNIFTKKDAITIIRKPVIKDIDVTTASKKITRGEDANIVIHGENFEKGDVRVTIVMSGVMSEVVKCKNSKVINYHLKGSVSKDILPGEYSIYIVNKDGTNAVSNSKISIR